MSPKYTERECRCHSQIETVRSALGEMLLCYYLSVNYVQSYKKRLRDFQCYITQPIATIIYNRLGTDCYSVPCLSDETRNRLLEMSLYIT